MKGKSKISVKKTKTQIKSVKRRTRKVKTQKGGAGTQPQERSNRKERRIVRFLKAFGRIFRKRPVQYYSATQGNPAFADPAVPKITQNHSESVSPVFSGFQSAKSTQSLPNKKKH